MFKNKLLKFIKRRKNQEQSTVKSYFSGFDNSIKNFENQLIEDEIKKMYLNIEVV